MESTIQNESSLFEDSARASLARSIAEHPSSRRITHVQGRKIIDWLTESRRQPTTQEEFSRRNYVRKMFVWDESESRLLAVSKSTSYRMRAVVFTDDIVDVVEQVHRTNGHGGWDTTWESINSHYYGILRADVILLLKTCRVCSHDPRKRPKGSVNLPAQPSTNLIETQSMR